MKPKAKKAIIISSIVVGSLAVVALTGGIVLDNIGVTYKIEVEPVKNPDYNVKIVPNEKYTTVAKYNADGSISDAPFKVMAFSDLHLDHKEALAGYSFNMMIRNINNEKPDMVVLLGDNLTSAFTKPRTKQLCETMENLGVYWTMVLGNHEHSPDNQWCITRDRMMRIASSYDHCLVNAQPKKNSKGEGVWGNGNHVVNIKNSKGISQSMFFLDSGDEMSKEDQAKYAEEKKLYDNGRIDDYIKDSQVTWYEDVVKDLKAAQPDVKSTIFFHVPPIESHEAYQQLTGETKVNPYNDSIVYKTIESGEDGVISGRRREGVCYSFHRSSIFEKARELGSTQAIFSGHDHSNDYVLRYKGMILGYCQTSGYSSNNVWTNGISQDLIEGYSLYTYQDNGSIGIEAKINKDVWSSQPELYQKAIDLITKASKAGSYVDKSSKYL